MAFDYGIIGKRLKAARENKGITQEKLAEYMQVSNAYVSKIERGKTPINLDRLSEMCKILEESPSYIITGADSNKDDYLRNEIVDMLQECPPEKIKLISEVIAPIVRYRG